ncbi:hypothetical protein EGJ28_16195 [Stutzerimonas xanthomarina]|jgi:hypothetical protein|uniref:Uncharacterized protein n=1 Tax=Stutzerimonas xanthomarina TaxID=271420 RepID=A0A3R9AR73_9GAMM|nr:MULTISPECIES: hypothetical protein [Stutzerimonas]MBK3919946.1 hypothetical protein [Stutzerimonas frequens]RRV08807.1 hypothetical protein EGJ28_16195 [Stutzerimonas xanthomarina]
MTTPTQRKPVPISNDTNLLDLGVEPGWFVRFGGCSIWFEIGAVWADMVSCAARDPKHLTVLATVGDYYSAIDHVCQELPASERWIKLDRTKSFYDKFYPERDKILAGAYVPQGQPDRPLD